MKAEFNRLRTLSPFIFCVALYDFRVPFDGGLFGSYVPNGIQVYVSRWVSMSIVALQIHKDYKRPRRGNENIKGVCHNLRLLEDQQRSCWSLTRDGIT